MASSAVAMAQMLSSVAEIGCSSSGRGRCWSGNVGGLKRGLNSSACPGLANISLSMSSPPSEVLNMDYAARPFKSQSRAADKVMTKKWTRSCSGEGSARTEEVPPMSEAEQAGWEQRQKEATETKDPADPFQWRWTLNWNSITPNIIVGSCPRSPGDIDRMVNEAGIDAILNLQSDLCFDALKIPYDAIRKRAVERGIRLERVAIRDFDHADQTLMLPVAVRLLNSLLGRGMKVYVHCTAGINRATLTTVGHLTFVQQMGLEEAVAMVKSARPVAHPYIDCWTEVRRRFLDGRRDEVTRISEEIYEARVLNNAEGTKLSDWVVAEKRVISQAFQRYLDTDLAMIEMETAWLKRRFAIEHKSGGNGSAAH